MPQNPYVQSGRLVPPATGGAAGLNRTLLNKMDQTLAELKVPNTPLPTKRVCDLYDSVRKDILLLLTLHKMVMQKEGNLQSKRVKLSKLRGGDRDILDEEALLGIAPPPTAPVSTAATSAAPKTAKGKGGKGKSGASKSKASAQKGKADADNKDGPKKKPAAKRKRKSEPKSAAGPGSTATTTKGGASSGGGKSAKSPVASTGTDTKEPPSKKRARKT